MERSSLIYDSRSHNMGGPSTKNFMIGFMTVVRTYSMSLLLSAGTLMILFMGVLPLLVERIDTSQKLRAYRDTVRALALKNEQLGGVDPIVLREKVDVGVGAVPLTLPYQASIVMLSNLISREHLSVTSMSFTREQLAQSTHIMIHVAVVGTYESIYRFVVSTQRVLPIVSLRSIDLSRTSPTLLFLDPLTSYRAEIIMAVRQSDLPVTIGNPSDRLPLLSPEQEAIYAQLKDFEIFLSPSSDSNPQPFDAVERLFAEEGN